MQFTFIESDDKVVNKATASNNHFLKWPLKTRKLFDRGRGTYLTTRITFSVFVSFSIKRQAFISHWFSAFRFFLLKWIKVTSHALYHRKRNRNLRWVINIAGRTSLPAFVQAFVFALWLLLLLLLLNLWANKFKIQILPNRMIYVEIKTQKNILSSRWELSPRPSMGYMYKQPRLFWS